MKKFLVLTLMLFALDGYTVCSSPISRTNFTSNQVLTSTRLNTELNTVYTRANELPGDCITDSTVSSAKIADGTIVNADISASAAIGRGKLASNYVASTSGSGSFATNSTSFVDVTNLTVTITTTGGAVEVFLIPEDGTNLSYVGPAINAGTDISGQIKLLRDATSVGIFYSASTGASGTLGDAVPAGAIRFFDTPAAGTYTYKLQALVSSASGSMRVNYSKLVAREL